MSKDLQAIKYLNDTCINFLDRTKELYCTVTFTRKRAEILRDNIAEVEQALKRLESIDNANPSEALECLEYIENKLRGLRVECERIKNHRCDDVFIQEHTFDTIKQVLLKAQFLEEEYNNLMEDKDNLESEFFKLTAPKHYLRWEDLEFKEETQKMNVKMGDNIYYIEWFNRNYKVVNFYTHLDDNTLHYTSYVSEEHKQFFNDLHLERVEE